MGTLGQIFRFPDESLFAKYPVPVYTPGRLARIITPEGAVPVS